MSADYDDEGEPGVPGRDTDQDGRPYFFPSNQRRAADSPVQRDGFTCRWQYRGHTGAPKSVCVTGEDSLGRIRVASTDGRGVHSWLELSDEDCMKTASGEFENITCMTFIARLDVLAAASVSSRLLYLFRARGLFLLHLSI